MCSKTSPLTKKIQILACGARLRKTSRTGAFLGYLVQFRDYELATIIGIYENKIYFLYLFYNKVLVYLSK